MTPTHFCRQFRQFGIPTLKWIKLDTHDIDHLQVLKSHPTGETSLYKDTEAYYIGQPYCQPYWDFVIPAESWDKFKSNFNQCYWKSGMFQYSNLSSIS